MFTVILIIIIVVVVALFSVQNASPVAVSFLFWHFEASLAVVILLAALAGMIAGIIAMSWSRVKRSVREKKTSAAERSNPDNQI